MNGATRPRPEWRTVDGILLLDKPEGLSSNQVLQRVRRLYRARKAGHTGSLDPLASGLLPLCFGQATKVAGFLLDADKTYRATLALGACTTTGDREGEVVGRSAIPPLDANSVAAVLDRFRGTSEQVPPMYSALKREGEALYAIARRGEVVERQPRVVRIEALKLVNLGAETLEFDVTCSKGTYVRTLGEDIARALGTVGHLSALRRTGIGGALEGRACHGLERLEALAGDERALDALLMSLDVALSALPAITLDAPASVRFCHGQPIATSGVAGTRLRAYAADGTFLGVGVMDATGACVQPERIMTASMSA